MSYVVNGGPYYYHFRRCNNYVIEQNGGADHFVKLKPNHLKEIKRAWKETVGVEISDDNSTLIFEDEEQFMLWAVKFS